MSCREDAVWKNGCFAELLALRSTSELVCSCTKGMDLRTGCTMLNSSTGRAAVTGAMGEGTSRDSKRAAAPLPVTSALLVAEQHGRVLSALCLAAVFLVRPCFRLSLADVSARYATPVPNRPKPRTKRGKTYSETGQPCANHRQKASVCYGLTALSLPPKIYGD